MIRPNDVDWMEIELAKDFIRKPLSEGFKAWSTLHDRDNVTMTIQELGHLMAWYADSHGDEDREGKADETGRWAASTAGEEWRCLTLPHTRSFYAESH
jgi:hypothetical protein